MIGTDIETIDRFNPKKLRHKETLFEKIFTQKELDYCMSKSKPEQHLAARFAGKEAIKKALCSAGKKSPFYNHIEIVHNKQGAPTVTGMPDVHVSLSHCDDKVVAVALIQ